MGKGILMYETTLSPDTKNRLKEIGRADVVVGIPSHRNGRTIPEVMRAIAKGLTHYLLGQRVVLMNADGGSSDNTTRHVAEAPVPPNVSKLVTTYEGVMGKGTAIRSIFEASAELQAKACVIIEARAPGIEPRWLQALIDPVLEGYDMALGYYQRSAYAASLTDNLAYPFARTFFNIHLREPLANEFCVSGELAEDLAGKDVWETDVARFGLNVWVSFQTLLEGRNVVQVDLGYRGDPSGEPGALSDPRIMHTVGTMFRFLTIHEKVWQRNPRAIQVPFYGERTTDRLIETGDCVGALVAAMGYGKRHYKTEWKRILEPNTLRTVLALPDQPPEALEIGPELWATIVSEFAVSYNKGEGDPDKVVESFLPLFYGRAATYVRHTHHLTPMQREAAVEEVVQTFMNIKPLFLDLWNRYQPWMDISERRPR